MRITLWVLAIFAVVHVTLALIVVMYHQRHIDATVRADLEATIRAVEDDQIRSAPDALIFASMQHAARWGPMAAVVLDPAGAPASTGGPYEPADFERLRQDLLTVSSQPDGGVHRTSQFVVAAAALPDGGRLLLAAPIEQIRRATDPVLLVLLLTLPVGLFSTGVATWSVAGVALRPIEQLQQFAEELSAETVSADVELEDTSPEVESLRAELQSAMERIEQGFESQARFLANVSHELKTPISVVQTEGQVLLAGDADAEDLKAFVTSTNEEMQRLGRMIESFLLLTRVRQGASRVRPQRCDANDLLMESVSHAAAMARQHGVTLAPMLHDGDVPEVDGNAELIQTAIDNLIRNAVRFSPADGRVEATCTIEDDIVVIAVRDHGPGVPPDVLDRIFEPFTQAADERRRGRGSGLGLQIAQGIAELHGGEVRVRNESVGCTFQLRLPHAAPAV